MNAGVVPLFRAMQPEEVLPVAEIAREICDFPWTPGNFRDALEAGYRCRVCELHGQVAGYAVLRVAAGEAHLLDIGIAKMWQGKGIGQQFLDHLIEIALDAGAAALFLEVRASNERAQRLYLASGFSRIAVRKNYYPALDSREDAILLERTLWKP